MSLGSRDTLNNLILKSPQNWQTSVGLPFFQIQGTVRHSFTRAIAQSTPNTSAHSSFSYWQVVEWDEVKFDVRLMQRVPYEGVSRMQTSLRRKHRDRVVRRGLALIIESDFYATDAGRQHFADQLTSIRYVRAAYPSTPAPAIRSPTPSCALRSACRRPATSMCSTPT